MVEEILYLYVVMSGKYTRTRLDNLLFRQIHDHGLVETWLGVTYIGLTGDSNLGYVVEGLVVNLSFYNIDITCLIVYAMHA